jgi:hypothetical protein
MYSAFIEARKTLTDESEFCMSELTRMSFLAGKSKSLTGEEDDEFSRLVDKWMVILYMRDRTGKADMDDFERWQNKQLGGHCKERGRPVESICSCR